MLYNTPVQHLHSRNDDSGQLHLRGKQEVTGAPLSWRRNHLPPHSQAGRWFDPVAEPIWQRPGKQLLGVLLSGVLPVVSGGAGTDRGCQTRHEPQGRRPYPRTNGRRPRAAGTRGRAGRPGASGRVSTTVPLSVLLVALDAPTPRHFIAKSRHARDPVVAIAVALMLRLELSKE